MAGAAASVGAVMDGGENLAATNPVLESHTHHDPSREAPEAGDEGRTRERRSRDRYGRDRKDRPAREEGQSDVAPVAEQAPVDDDTAAERRPRYATGFVSDDSQAAPAASAPVDAAPVAEAAPAAPTAAAQPAIAPIAVAPATSRPAPSAAPASASAAPSTPARGGLPKVSPFELPVDDLAQVAASSGLQWVNSDADKIAAVQAAIASEPRPSRVPRERPALPVIDQGPLVLVETRRDLSEMKLPFEQQPPGATLQ